MTHAVFSRDRKMYRVAYLVASVVIGIILLSAYHKILYPDEFALTVYRFHILPDVLVNGVAIYLGWLELICALCLLLVPRWRVAALWLTVMMFAVFTVGIAVNLLRGSSFSCGCFSSSPLARPMSWLSVLRNLGLIAMAVIALISDLRIKRSLAPTSD